DPVCFSCQHQRSRRTYATAATTAVENQAQANLSYIHPVTSISLQQAYQVRAGVVLSRPPILTRDLHPFEKAFYLYQRRLNERLALPFTRYFYFKKGTPADVEWKRKVKTRLTPARDIGVYNAYGDEGWNDEVLVGAKEAETEWQVESLLKDAEAPVTGIPGQENGDGIGTPDGIKFGGEQVPEVSSKKGKAETVEKLMPRVTAADRRGDVKSLDRLLQRSLYLLVKNREGRWTFPDDKVVGRENLHQAAERVLVQAGGLNMNTWVVGNAPIGHYSFDFLTRRSDLQKNVEELGEKVFFMKARIMAGQANLTNNKFGLSDFKWLAKEEIESTVTPRYWNAIRNMLAER
ncbi:mitochondrial 54S ribosomal protein mL46, partial [Cenococcum geophilum 1.58]|uniref:mitochondrial 54S ribosomal protein mL46 n=1 Tax=Cenococcum geophilum 1.58 TaxID=794803 RepID=UPI00358F4B2C